MAANDPSRILYLVDGTSQLYRAYFAIRGLTNAAGLPTNAVYGFTTMLRKLMQDEQPPFLGVAFDMPGPVFRHETFADYKANRPPTPADLKQQLPYAKQVCELYGVPVLELGGYEADDLIGTLTARARAEGFEVVVVASDKDLLQLVGPGVTVLNPSKELRLDPDGVRESFGVAPDHVIDVLGLMGDSVDNVPGVPGVGRKSALSVVSTYGAMDAVFLRAETFVTVYDARDLLLARIDEAGRQTPLTEEGARDVGRAAADLRSALDELIGLERNEAFAERLRGLASLLDDGQAGALDQGAGKPGRAAIKPLSALRRELKALDRGSDKRIWYSIAEHREQAQLSRELVTLHLEAPFEFSADRLRRSPPDEEGLKTLFRSLGFDSLLAELGDSAESGPTVEIAHAVVLEEGQLEDLVRRCRESSGPGLWIVTDEADPQRAAIVGIALAPAGDDASYVPLAHDYLQAPPQLAVETVARHLGPLLADVDLPKPGHDLKRAVHILERHGLSFEGWGMDTMVAAFVLDASRSRYPLEAMARAYLGREIHGEEPGRGSTNAGLDVERVGARAAGCAAAVRALADELETRLDAAELGEVYRTIDHPLLPLLARMERRGIRIDTELLATMSGEMEQAVVRTRAKIHALAGVEFNVDSPKQLREVLFEKLQLKPGRKTAKSKAASTDAQTLDELAGEHAIAGKILEYRELAKLKGTYVDSLPRLVHPETGRVHTCFNPTGAATGRLSSSDPNLQNIPVRTEAGRKIRAAFVPEEGHLFLASDYSQIELRVLAHLTRDPELVAAFRSGEDIHRHTAARVFGVHPELVTDGMRRRAKAVNFGILYGMSETRLAREQGMTRSEARRFIRTYFERFAKVEGYIAAVREQAERDASVCTLFGRIRPFPQLRQQVNRAVREQALRAAVNTTLQGTAADLMKLAMLAVAGELERGAHGAHMLLQVHDELLLEVPEESIEPVAEIVRGAMEKVHPLEVPLVADQKVGKSWLDVT